MKNRQNVKTMFISDCHIGCKYSKAENLLALLKKYNPENLFLVGDIIDGWRLKKRIYWNDTYSFIVRRIIGMMKNGTKVFYVAGNHDEFLRKFLPNSFGHLEIVDEYIYHSISGKKMLVIHGDIFDACVVKWFYWIGDAAYSLSLLLNSFYNFIRRNFGFKYWSLSQMLKRNTKKAVNFIGKFEHFISKYTQEKGCDAVICGHIHHPEIKEVEGIQYYNCGDWIESCTAIIEHLDGNFELVELINCPVDETKEFL